MRTLLEHRPTVDATAEDVAPTTTHAPEVFDDDIPDTRGAPRSARRIAMNARRQQDRLISGW